MNAPTQPLGDPLVIAGKAYASRLLIGTGKYRDFDETRRAVEASGAEIVTVAIRRTNIGQNANEPSLLDALPPSKYTYLPNTAGCYSADDAVRTLRLARELLDGHDLVKLEVLGDPHTLFPNVIETLKAAATLVKDGFKVMVYTSDDPIIAKELEAIGCVAVMPLASLIGSGMGILNPWNLQLILEKASVPIVVDAGVGTASDAAIAMELGCDAVLMNTAIAKARDPVLMAQAMRKSGRGRPRRVPRRPHAEEALLGEPELPDRRTDHPEAPRAAASGDDRPAAPLDPQLRPEAGPHHVGAGARACAARPHLRHCVRGGAARSRARVRAHGTEGARDRLRDGRDDGGDRRGASGDRLPRHRGALARRGQPAEPDRGAAPDERARDPARRGRGPRADDRAGGARRSAPLLPPIRGPRSGTTSADSSRHRSCGSSRRA